MVDNRPASPTASRIGTAAATPADPPERTGCTDSTGPLLEPRFDGECLDFTDSSGAAGALVSCYLERCAAQARLDLAADRAQSTPQGHAPVEAIVSALLHKALWGRTVA